MDKVELLFKTSNIQEDLITNYFTNFELFKKDGFTLQLLCERILLEDYSIQFNSQIELPRGIKLHEVSQNILKETVNLICMEKKIQNGINAKKEIATGILAGKVSAILNTPIEITYPIVWAVVHYSVKVPQNIFCEKFSYLMKK